MVLPLDVIAIGNVEGDLAEGIRVEIFRFNGLDISSISGYFGAASLLLLEGFPIIVHFFRYMAM